MILKSDGRRALLGAALGAIAASATVAAQDTTASSGPSVFDSVTPLQLTLRTDLRTLIRDRGEDRAEHDGIARITRADGGIDSATVQLRTRGIFRRRPSVCGFPPLRLSVGRRRARRSEERRA